MKKFFNTLLNFKRNPHQEEIDLLKKAGFKRFPTKADLVVFGTKTLLIYPDQEGDLAKLLMKILEYKARIIYHSPSDPPRETRTIYLFFEYILDVLSSPYRTKDLLGLCSRAEHLSIATKKSALSPEALAFIKNAGISVIKVCFDKKKKTISFASYSK